MSSLFYNPDINPQRRENIRLSKKRKRERLRNLKNKNDDAEGVNDGVTIDVFEPTASRPIEYAAVLSPAERSQRQLAGQPLNEAPPSWPFPHARLKGTETQDAHTSIWQATRNPRKETNEAATGVSKPFPSLHLQHLSALIAILYRGLLTRDFRRASWAFGMMIREDVKGTPIDIRHGGNWGIGAELLFRNGNDGQSSGNAKTSFSVFRPSNFKQVKEYYENLIVLFPYNKQWADSVNSIDFYLAMFGLWIYSVNAEDNPAQDTPNMTSAESLFLPESSLDPDTDRANKNRLLQATEIAERMDTCMANVPYSDNKDFLRLRAMTALWIADLNDFCVRSSRLNPDMLPEDEFVDLDSDNEDSEVHKYTRQAAAERDRAQQLFLKLDGPGATSDDDNE